jgi:hypothetical protein
MSESELVYMGDVRRVILRHAPEAAFCLSMMKPFELERSAPSRSTSIPKMDDYWIARVQYWPEDDPKNDIVCIYYVWGNGEIDFIAFGGGYVVSSSQCAHFELIERLEVNRAR